MMETGYYMIKYIMENGFFVVLYRRWLSWKNTGIVMKN